MIALLIVNSRSRRYLDGIHALIPRLDHFGVPFRALDIATAPAPDDLRGYALLILAHSNLDSGVAGNETAFSRILETAVRDRCGVVSFDPGMLIHHGAPSASRPPAVAESVEIAPDHPHFVTAYHTPGEVLPLLRSMRVPPIEATGGQVLVTAGDRPLVAAHEVKGCKVVQWATAEWMYSDVLGPLAGLDDVLWRSLVWAARKPFALRCLPPLVAMRVDDVCGLGEAWGQSPLYWVEIANQNGFRPWLGLFLHNLSNGAIDQLRGLLLGGTASAFPHALGRPVKDGAGDRDSARISMPLRTSAQDEFIYFDHHGGRPWPDRELDRRVAAVDAWYAQTTLPVSSYALPHWYEMGRNCARYLADTWHVQFLGLCSQPGSVFGRDTPWLRAAPFRLYEDAGTCYFHKDDRGLQPVYYADWIDVDDRRFFNSLVEIRGAPDYEWEPDNDVTATAQRGICHLLRALDSLALAVLFTHETDHIRDIRPDSWDATLSQISKGIAGHSPQFVTIDMAAQYQRAMCTSRLAAADYDPEQNAILLRLTGHTDLPTHVRVFLESDDGVGSTYVEAPALEGEVVLSVAVKDLTVSPCEHSTLNSVIE